MKSREDYRISVVQHAQVSGRMCKVFMAWVRQGDAFVFEGEFCAPANCSNRDLWRVVAEWSDEPVDK